MFVFEITIIILEITYSSKSSRGILYMNHVLKKKIFSMKVNSLPINNRIQCNLNSTVTSNGQIGHHIRYIKSRKRSIIIELYEKKSGPHTNHCMEIEQCRVFPFQQLPLHCSFSQQNNQ